MGQVKSMNLNVSNNIIDSVSDFDNPKYSDYQGMEIDFDSNNRIIINNNEQKDKFLKYINNWKPENHTMVAETMIK